MKNIGLVLEGGGMRGIYTAGVLDFFMEKKLYLPYVIGVSAGACNGASYISKQRGRNKKVLIDYVKCPNFFGFRNIVRDRSLLGMKLIFEDIPKRYEPFDFKGFFNNKQRFIVTTTDCETGEALYIEKKCIDKYDDIEGRNDKMLKVVKASSSLPFIAPIVNLDGKKLLDGGICDPIPLKKAESDEMLNNIVVLTRDKNYRKKRTKYRGMIKRIYNDKIADVLSRRHEIYNGTLDYIKKQEERDKVFIIRPSKPIDIDIFERNEERLEEVYKLGYMDAERRYTELVRWIYRITMYQGDERKNIAI